MDREAIEKILPHRDAMLLLDQVEQVDETAVGVYHVRGDEWFLQGHFPNHPVMPGVIQCEILAQATCILMKDVLQENQLPLYTGLNKVRFRSSVVPGDEFVAKCQITRAKPPFYFAEGKGYVGDRLCVEASFSFAIVENK